MRFKTQCLSTDCEAVQYCQQLKEQLRRINVSGDVNGLWGPIHEAVNKMARKGDDSETTGSLKSARE